MTANGTISNFTTIEAAGLTVNFLGTVRGPGNITASGAITVNANTTNGGLIEGVHDIAGSTLTLNGTIRDVTGTITTTTTAALGTGSLLSNVAVGGLVAGTTVTVAGNIFNVATFSGTTVTVNNLGTISGTGNVEARTGNLTVNSGGSINVDGQITAATNALIQSNASVAATGNVTFSGGLFLGRADANNVAVQPGTLTIGTGASLLVGNVTPADVRIGENIVGNAGGPAIGILDATQATSVNITSLNFSLGQANANLVEAYGHLMLPTVAGGNTLITTTGTNTVRVGVAIPVLGPNRTDESVFVAETYGSVLDLGNQTVTIVTSGLNVAAAKASGTVRFNGLGGNLTINNGTTATAFNLAVDANIAAHDSQIVGWFDMRGGTLNANFGAVVLGSVAAAASGNISAQATFILDGADSNVTAASVVMGRSLLVAPNDAISDTYGNLTILNGNFTVTGSLATSTGGSTDTPTLVSLKGGMLAIGTTINFGNGIARLEVDGGTLNLGTGALIGNLAGNSSLAVSAGLVNANDRNLGNAAVPLHIATLTGGTILNANVICVTGGFVQSGGTLQRNLGNTTTVINGYTIDGGYAIINGGLIVTGGSGITVNGGTLKGTGTVTITSQPLVVASGGTLAPGGSPGTLTVAGSSGITITGTLAIDFGNVGTMLNDFSPNGESSATSNQSLLNATGASFSLDLTGATITISANAPIELGGFYSWVIATLPAGSTVENELGGGLIDRSTYTIDSTQFAAGQYSGSADDTSFSLYHTGNTVVLASTAPVPEPLGISLIGGLSLAVYGWSRRRSRRNRSHE